MDIFELIKTRRSIRKFTDEPVSDEIIHSTGLGAVWLGEILKNKDKVLQLMGGAQDLELMAVIAFGHPAEKGGKGMRKDAAQTIIFRK